MRVANRRTSLLILGLIAVAFAAPGFAGVRHDHRFERHHPRRDQVLDRTQRQSHRITDQVRDGDLTHAQAHALRQSDHSVALQQRADAKTNGGYITKSQQKSLNQELNANSRQIGH
jgi:hypothetical protein